MSTFEDTVVGVLYKDYSIWTYFIFCFLLYKMLVTLLLLSYIYWTHLSELSCLIDVFLFYFVCCVGAPNFYYFWDLYCKLWLSYLITCLCWYSF